MSLHSNPQENTLENTKHLIQTQKQENIPMAPKVTRKKSFDTSHLLITCPSISQKTKKYFNEQFRYTEDGTCAYCGFGPKNPLPSWPKNWRCSLTHSDDDPKLAKYPELWAKIKNQSDYLM